MNIKQKCTIVYFLIWYFRDFGKNFKFSKFWIWIHITGLNMHKFCIVDGSGTGVSLALYFPQILPLAELISFPGINSSKNKHYFIIKILTGLSQL